MKDLYANVRDRISKIICDDLGTDKIKLISESWQPDVIGLEKPVIGEIKSSKELKKSDTWWSHWQSPKIILPGKPAEKTLEQMEGIKKSEFSRSSKEARLKGNLVAVIMGQLKYSYVLPSGIKEGWLFLELSEDAKEKADVITAFESAIIWLKGRGKIGPNVCCNQNDNIAWAKIVYV